MWPMFLSLTLWASSAALPTPNRATGGPTLSELQQTLLQSQNRNRVLLEILKVRAPGAALRPYRQHLVQAGHLDGLGRPALKALLLQARQDRRRLEMLKSGAGQLPGSGQLLGRRTDDMSVTSTGAVVTDWNVVPPTDLLDPSEGGDGDGDGPSRGGDDGEEGDGEDGEDGLGEGEGRIVVPLLGDGDDGSSEEGSSSDEDDDTEGDNAGNPTPGKNGGISVHLPEEILEGQGHGKKLTLLLHVKIPLEMDGKSSNAQLENLHVVGNPELTEVKEKVEVPNVPDRDFDGDGYDGDFGYDNDFAEAGSNNGFGQYQGYHEGDFGGLDNDFASGGFGQGNNYDRDSAPTAVLVDTSDYQGPPADMDEVVADLDEPEHETPTLEDLDDDFEYNRK